MIELKFKVGDVLVLKDSRGYANKITILEVNPSDKVNAYRTSETSDYWWHKDTIESYYELSGEKQPPKFKVGDIIESLNNDHFRRLIREIDNEGYYVVSRYNTDMLYPDDDRFTLTPAYIHRHYQLVGQGDDFNILLEKARRDYKRFNKAHLDYLKYQEEYERAMDAFDKAQLAVNQYVQSKINNGLED